MRICRTKIVQTEIQNLCAKIVYLMVRSQIRGVLTIHMHIDFFAR